MESHETSQRTEGESQDLSPPLTSCPIPWLSELSRLPREGDVERVSVRQMTSDLDSQLRDAREKIEQLVRKSCDQVT